MGVTALAYNDYSIDLWVILGNFPRKRGLPCKGLTQAGSDRLTVPEV